MLRGLKLETKTVEESLKLKKIISSEQFCPQECLRRPQFTKQ